MARSINRNASSGSPSDNVRGFIPPQTDAERILMRHVEDLCRVCEKRGIARYTGFLNDREQLLAKAAVPKNAGVVARFTGGVPNAERKMLCVTPFGMTEEECVVPIACVKVLPKLISGAKPPVHKDYLGSLMGLSFERSCIGDILLPEDAKGAAYLFVQENVLPLVLQEFTSVGRICVQTQEIAFADLPDFAQVNRELQSTTVPSLRLDAVLAAMMRCSRGMAADYIAAGRVEINHLPTTSQHTGVYPQDIFTIRGKGRYQLVSLQGKSKKDRFIIEYFRF